jgi:hypothetical protein
MTMTKRVRDIDGREVEIAEDGEVIRVPLVMMDSRLAMSSMAAKPGRWSIGSAPLTAAS